MDLAAIVANWRALKAQAAPAACAAVVKADGYGCGLEEVSRALGEAGCTTFFVAHLSEGRRLRAVLPEATVYVLNGLLPGTASAYAEADLRPVLGSLEEMEEWRAFRASTGWDGGAALHIDTGMNRLGLSMEEAAILARSRDRTRGLTLLMSHLACAETPDHPLNRRQMARFAEMRALFPRLPASLANSAGIFLSRDAHHDVVRPGVALYGANPTPTSPNPMRPAVELHGRIVQVRDLARGESVGYGAAWTAHRPTRLAVVSVGYADGVLRAASGLAEKPGADAIVAGQRCPLVGMISMDLLAVDVTDVPGGGPRRGDLVTLIGDGISVDEIAARAGTIAYEVLAALGRRYHRSYRIG